MTLYIVDASVVARFLLSEELSDKAEQVLKDFMEGKISVASPKLVIYEVGNALWKAVKSGFITLEEAEEKLRCLLKLKIGTVNLEDEDYKETLKWSSRKGMTYYDGVYVISSKKAGGILLTADDVLHDKARGDIKSVHLKDYKT